MHDKRPVVSLGDESVSRERAEVRGERAARCGHLRRVRELGAREAVTCFEYVIEQAPFSRFQPRLPERQASSHVVGHFGTHVAEPLEALFRSSEQLGRGLLDQPLSSQRAPVGREGAARYFHRGGARDLGFGHGARCERGEARQHAQNARFEARGRGSGGRTGSGQCSLCLCSAGGLAWSPDRRRVADMGRRLLSDVDAGQVTDFIEGGRCDRERFFEVRGAAKQRGPINGLSTEGFEFGSESGELGRLCAGASRGRDRFRSFRGRARLRCV